MSDTNRLPRIGEIWKVKEAKFRLVVTAIQDNFVYYVWDDLSTDSMVINDFVSMFEPTNTEYDLDPLVLALKGDRT